MEADPQVPNQRVLSLLVEYISSFWVPLRMQQKLLSQHLLNGSNALQLQTFVKSSSQRCLTVSKQSSSVVVSERLPESIPKTVFIILIKKASFATSMASLFDLAENLDIMVVNLKEQKDPLPYIISLFKNIGQTLFVQDKALKEIQSNPSFLPPQNIQKLLEYSYGRREQYKAMTMETRMMKQSDQRWQQVQHYKSLREQIQIQKRNIILTQTKIEQLKAEINRQIQKSQPLFINARKNLENISNNDFNVLRGFHKPPAVVEFLMKALFILIENQPSMARQPQNITFAQIRAGFIRPRLIERMISLQPDGSHDFVAQCVVRNFIESDQWNIERIKKASFASGILAQWIEAFLGFKDRLKRLEPMMKEVEKLNEQQNLFKKEAKDLQSKMVLLQEFSRQAIEREKQAFEKKAQIQNQVRGHIIEMLFSLNSFESK